MSQPIEEVWIGLAEVEQRPGAGMLLDRNFAYVQVLALARDATQFRSEVEEFFARNGFDVIALEDDVPMRSRIKECDVPDEILDLAGEVAAGAGPRWGTFHTWVEEG